VVLTGGRPGGWENGSAGLRYSSFLAQQRASDLVENLKTEATGVLRERRGKERKTRQKDRYSQVVQKPEIGRRQKTRRRRRRERGGKWCRSVWSESHVIHPLGALILGKEGRVAVRGGEKKVTADREKPGKDYLRNSVEGLSRHFGGQKRSIQKPFQGATTEGRSSL